VKTKQAGRLSGLNIFANRVNLLDDLAGKNSFNGLFDVWQE
jgi:hypothetical protein